MLPLCKIKLRFYQLPLFTKLCLSVQAADFRPNSKKFDLLCLPMGTRIILLHPHQLRRSDISTSHINMDPKTPRFTCTFDGWKKFKPNLKNKVIQPFSVASLLLLLKHVLFLPLDLFYPQSRRIYYLPITTIMLFIKLCATAIGGT